MIKQLFFGGLAIFLTGITETNAAPRSSQDLRLMSYNVKHGAGLDDKLDPQRTSSVIVRFNPDIVAVQEVDSATARSKGLYTLGELAARTGMYPIFAPAISYDGGKYGQGILTKERPLFYRVISLPGKEEKRSLLIAEFKKYVFCSTHLSLTPEDQMASLRILLKETKEFTKPVFLAGDLNVHPDDPFIREAQTHFVILNNTIERTYPADKPDETLDYIMVSKKYAQHMAVRSTEVVNEPQASDHRPVTVIIRLR